MLKKRITFLAAICSLQMQSALAANFAIELEIPEIHTAEYHRPYVAVWVENSSRKQILQIILWLEQEKWHRDLRSWWRRGGKSLALPVDGVSGATRRPGTYSLKGAAELAAGKYTLNVEAVREVGGREHIRIPFTWSGETIKGDGVGKTELGIVSYTIEENER